MVVFKYVDLNARPKELTKMRREFSGRYRSYSSFP